MVYVLCAKRDSWPASVLELYHLGAIEKCLFSSHPHNADDLRCWALSWLSAAVSLDLEPGCQIGL